MAEVNCICQFRRLSNSKAAFLIMMHDAEVLKPSNTARLIADVVPETFAFIWSRTSVDEKLSALLLEQRYYPMVVFPRQYVAQEQIVYENQLPSQALSNKIPLFILLDGSWREAKKMFRKSEYLKSLPVVSFRQNEGEEKANYIREAALTNQLSTAQVAAKMLSLYGEENNAIHLASWFDVFNYHYQRSVCQPNLGKENALLEYQSFLGITKS